MIAVIFGGLSAEHDVSVLTGLQAGRVLHDAGHEVQLIYWTKQSKFELVEQGAEADAFVAPDRGFRAVSFSIPEGFVEQSRMRKQALPVELVLNCCHGGPGEEGVLEGLLRLAGLRVTGPSQVASAICMDKLASTAAAELLGVDSIPSMVFDPTDSSSSPPFPAPWVAKPRFGGSSLGVEVGVEDTQTLRSLASIGSARGGLIVQPYLDGWIDLNVSVRSYPDHQVSEIERPEVTGVYDYSTKYLSGADGMESAPRELPANLPAPITQTVKESALKIARGLQLTGAPRIDFMWDGDGSVLFNEINPIPGAFGLYLWNASGVTRERFLLDLLDEARSGPIVSPSWSDSSDGAALRAAGSIAGKLT